MTKESGSEILSGLSPFAKHLAMSWKHIHFSVRPVCIKAMVTEWIFWIESRVLWRDAVEEKEREPTVSEEEVCTDRERIYPVLLQQGKCEFPAALT